MKKKTNILSLGQATNQTLFWVVFGIIVVGAALLLLTGSYQPQVQPQAFVGDSCVNDSDCLSDEICVNGACEQDGYPTPGCPEGSYSDITTCEQLTGGDPPCVDIGNENPGCYAPDYAQLQGPPSESAAPTFGARKTMTGPPLVDLGNPQTLPSETPPVPSVCDDIFGTLPS